MFLYHKIKYLILNPYSWFIAFAAKSLSDVKNPYLISLKTRARLLWNSPDRLLTLSLWLFYAGYSFIKHHKPHQVSLAYVRTAARWLKHNTALVIGAIVAMLNFLVLYAIPTTTWVFVIATALGVTYTLITGYVYFIVHAGFGRSTDIDQRFWKRSFAVFWLLEVNLFMILIYLILTVPSEVLFSFESLGEIPMLNCSFKEFVYKGDYYSCFLLLMLCLIQFNKEGNSSVTNVTIATLILLFIHIFVGEAGVFYYYINSGLLPKWLWAESGQALVFDQEYARKRPIHGLIILVSIIKFWHLIFVGVMWFFYFSRHFESRENRDILLSAVYQSFVILYFLNILLLIPGLKKTLKPYLSASYYWFYEMPHSEYLSIVTDLFFNLLPF